MAQRLITLRSWVNCSYSTSVSVTSLAAQFSSRCASEDVPGIGSMTGERRSSQAREICDTVAPCCAAIASSAPPTEESLTLPKGNHGIKPI